MKSDEKERKSKQLELANLFYEMGMPFDVVEKISGIDSREFIVDSIRKNKTTNQSKKIDTPQDDIYNNN